MEASALPRIGLLGNPSDLYGGRVISFTFENFVARVRIESANGVEFDDPDGRLSFEWSDVLEADFLTRCDPEARLLGATLRRFVRRFPDFAEEAASSPRLGVRFSLTTNIPRQVGLAGSSAIVIAGLRALCLRAKAQLEPRELAEIALAVETEELGIIAGPQDRWVQAFEGPLYMDFSSPEPSATRLESAHLPEMLVAYNPDPGESSGSVHNDVRERWEAGDPLVHKAMSVLSELAEEGLGCLRAGRFDRVRELINRNFDTRASLYSIGPLDTELVRIARERFVSAKLCGSGGAVLCTARNEAEFEPLDRAFRAAGFATLRPKVSEPAKDED